MRPGSVAARVGLEPGDLIRRINNKNLSGIDEFRDVIVQARGAPSVLLLVSRGARGYYITLPF